MDAHLLVSEIVLLTWWPWYTKLSRISDDD